MGFKLTDAGRSKSRRPNQKRDCTVRAVAITCGFSYDDAYMLLRKAGRECSRGFDIEAWARKNIIRYEDGRPCWMFRLHKMPPVGTPRRYRLSDFLRDHPHGPFMVSTAKHVFAVVDGLAHDDLPYHFQDDRPVYAWIELKPVRLPLWQVFALRRPIKKGGLRMVKRCVAIVEGIAYKSAMRVASKQYEWALKTNEDLTVEPFGAEEPYDACE